MPKEPDTVEDLPSPASSGGGGGSPLVPVLAVAILIPLITIGLFEFYFFPKVKESIAEATKPHSEEGGEGGAHGVGDVKRGEIAHTYSFDNIVVNLSGALKARYLKVSFTVESRVEGFEGIMEHNKARLIDATLGVLSQLTLQDMNEPGIKNIVRSDLLNAFGSALRGNVVDNLFFSEFVLQ
jgi:flagellar protein FliL